MSISLDVLCHFADYLEKLGGETINYNTIPCYEPSFVGSLSQHRYNKSLLSEEFSLSSSVRPIGMDVNVL